MQISIPEQKERMTGRGYRENILVACEGMRGVSICVPDSVFCPKPRRVAFVNPSINPQTFSYQRESSDSRFGTDLLDIILEKGGCGVEKSNNQVASSPPFFCGSPPSRASNPLIQDSQFGQDKFSPLLQELIPATSPSPSARKGASCVRVKSGHNPVAVRIEGFKCLSQDRRSISAVA